MEQLAKITDLMTRGYVEVRLIENRRLGRERMIAQIPVSMRGEQGDIVTIEPLESRNVHSSWIRYLAVPAFFLLAFFAGSSLDLANRMVSGAIVGLMAFLICWIMDRRSRMMRRQQYKVTEIRQKHRDI